MTDIEDGLEGHQPNIIEGATSGLPEESSLLDALAQERQTIADTREVDIPVFQTRNEAGYTLYARYRLLDAPELERIGQKVTREFKKPFDRNLYGSIDVFLAACVGFFVDLGDGEKKPVTLNGSPILGYDMDLATALKFVDQVNPQNLRTIVTALFGGNVIAIQQHNLMLGRWMSNTAADVTTEFLEAAAGNR